MKIDYRTLHVSRETIKESPHAPNIEMDTSKRIVEGNGADYYVPIIDLIHLMLQ